MKLTRQLNLSERMAWDSILFANEAIRNAQEHLKRARKQMTEAKRFARHVRFSKAEIQQAIDADIILDREWI